MVEKYEGVRLETDGRRLVLEVAGPEVCEWAVEAVEADRMSLDVEVAEVTVEARTTEALEVLEATVGGRRVEVIEADVLSRIVEADRMNLDVEVAEVTVETRTVEALEVLEATFEGCTREFTKVDVLARLGPGRRRWRVVESELEGQTVEAELVRGGDS